MQNAFPLFPESASTMSGQVDALTFFLTLVSGLMTLLIFATITILAIKYRRRSPNDPLPAPIHGSWLLESTWSIVPFLVMLIMFAWGARLFFDNYTPPVGAMEIFVVGKQWMWKVQHPEGQREINELHIPVGRPIMLTMASEDVIHSFFIPAFRVKHDVVPGVGRYSQLWFNATKVGDYHLFCAEYCGNQHSGMTGWIHVMEPADYQAWLSLHGGNATMAEAGETLFGQLGCATCHAPGATPPNLSLTNMYGHPVQLVGGATVLADENYIRESIINPRAKVVLGYPPVMPTYQGQVTEEGVLQLIAYIKSLSRPSERPAANNANAREGTKK
jgi:cytochrome c oxidase subunit II